MQENKENKNEERCYTVYMHTSPSGKRYIGITSLQVEKRWSNGYGYKDNEYFTKAIKKYTWSNIKHEIMVTDLTKEEAEEKEIELIAYYKSNQREYGYNIQNGGSSIGKHSEETKQKMRDNHWNMSGENHPMYGKHHSDETRKRLSESHIGVSFSEETRKKLSELHKNPSKETRQKMSESHKGKNHPMYGKHHSEETKLKISKSKIGKHLSDETRMKMKESNKGKTSRTVYQYDKNGIFLEEYVSISEASSRTNINKGDISSCCRKRLKHAGHYIWRYADDENNEFRQAV